MLKFYTTKGWIVAITANVAWLTLYVVGFIVMGWKGVLLAVAANTIFFALQIGYGFLFPHKVVREGILSREFVQWCATTDGLLTEDDENGKLTVTPR